VQGQNGKPLAEGGEPQILEREIGLDFTFTVNPGFGVFVKCVNENMVNKLNNQFV
jgi:hypothetical protein